MFDHKVYCNAKTKTSATSGKQKPIRVGVDDLPSSISIMALKDLSTDFFAWIRLFGWTSSSSSSSEILIAFVLGLTLLALDLDLPFEMTGGETARDDGPDDGIGESESESSGRTDLRLTPRCLRSQHRSIK